MTDKPEITTEQMLAYCSDIINDGGYNTQVPMWEAIRLRLADYDSLKTEVERLKQDKSIVELSEEYAHHDLGVVIEYCEKIETELKTRTKQADQATILLGEEQLKVEEAEALISALEQELGDKKWAVNERDKELEAARPILEAIKNSAVWSSENKEDFFDFDIAGRIAILDAALSYRKVMEQKDEPGTC